MSDSYALGIGLDIGTSHLVVSRMNSETELPEFVMERDAFYAINPTSAIAAKFVEKSLLQKKAFVLKSGNTFFVVGRPAIETALERGGNVERPLKRGVLSIRDKESMNMLAVLVKALVGEAQSPLEPCVYSYPADPVDQKFDVVYHQNRMSEILGGLGYKAVPLLEAEALAYSELMDDEIGGTGIVLSCGAGMHNAAVFYTGDCITSFSIALGGDYIDRSVAEPLGMSETEVQAEKETNLDLNNPQGKVQETIVMYYRNLVDHVMDILEKKFNQIDDLPRFTKPIIFIISGGSTMPAGYQDLFVKFLKNKYDVRTKELPLIRERTFPFQIAEVRRPSDPLTSVANGCLVYAQAMLKEANEL